MTKKAQELDGTGRAAIVRELDKSLDAAYGNTFKETLHEIALQSRLLIGAHQSAISYIPDKDFMKAIHTHSFSRKYEKYNSYDVMPTGKGIWRVIVEKNIPMLMTDEELKSHMHWKNFSNLKNDRGLEHPPMRGWLAMPVQRVNGEFIGVLQLSDRIEGDFTEKDQKTLTPFCRVAGLAFELYYINGELQKSNEDLERFNRLATGREERMIELKREVNTLSGKLGCPLPYQV